MTRKIDVLICERVLGLRVVGVREFLESTDTTGMLATDSVPPYSTSLDAVWPVGMEQGRLVLKARDDTTQPYVFADVFRNGRNWIVDERSLHPATAICLALLRAHGVSEEEIEAALAGEAPGT